MIIIFKKSSVIMVCLAFVLLLVILSLNMDVGKDVGAVQDKIVDKSVGEAGENKDQKTIIIDPGHGGEDPGAVSSYSGAKEKDLNLIIAFKLKELLEEKDFKIIMTRTEDILEYDENAKNVYQKRKQDLTRRKEIMDQSGADIVISIHLNEFSQTQYYGAQVFYPPNSSDSQALANSIQKALREKVDPTNKRVAMLKEPPKGEKAIMILRDLKTPTVVVECGFLSNADEERELRKDEYQDKIAKAIETGIIDYFNNKS